MALIELDELLDCVVVRIRLRAAPMARRGDGKAHATRMSLTATARSIPGTLRQEVVIDGKHRLITDEPERLGGEGSGPAPHELFPAALAACVATTLAMYARTKGWDLGEVTVDVDYDNRSTPRRFEIAIELGGELSRRAARTAGEGRRVVPGAPLDRGRHRVRRNDSSTRTNGAPRREVRHEQRSGS